MPKPNPFTIAHELRDQLTAAIEVADRLEEAEHLDGMNLVIRRAVLCLKEAEIYTEMCIREIGRGNLKRVEEAEGGLLGEEQT